MHLSTFQKLGVKHDTEDLNVRVKCNVEYCKHPPGLTPCNVPYNLSHNVRFQGQISDMHQCDTMFVQLLG